MYDGETPLATTLGLQETACHFGLSLGSVWILSCRGALSYLSLMFVHISDPSVSLGHGASLWVWKLAPVGTFLRGPLL